MNAKPTTTTLKSPSTPPRGYYSPFFDKKAIASAVEYAIRKQRKVMGLDKD